MIDLTTTASLAGSLNDIVEALRVPVIVVGLVALLATAVELGRWAVEVVRRYRRRRAGVATQGARAIAEHPPSRLAGAAAAELLKDSGSPERIEDTLADFELSAQKKLDRTRILVRVGPAIGLMGTLIPLAPGLSALADGDLGELASELQTAFAMTVIGLLIGAVAFAITVARTRYYAEDLALLERAARTLRQGGGQ